MRARKQLGNALHLDERAIREHFRDSLHHLGGVIAHGDNRVGAVFGSMLQEQFKSILARLLAKICKDGDVPTYNGLKRGPRLPITLLERTMIPRTIPTFLTIRYPGISRPDVTIEKSARGISSSPSPGGPSSSSTFSVLTGMGS